VDLLYNLSNFMDLLWTDCGFVVELVDVCRELKFMHDKNGKPTIRGN
jgi:hypothetical protein